MLSAKLSYSRAFAPFAGNKWVAATVGRVGEARRQRLTADGPILRWGRLYSPELATLRSPARGPVAPAVAKEGQGPISKPEM